MIADPRFDACLPFILREEGGNDDDPHDHGGRTSRGVIQREYSLWRVRHGLPERDVWLASDEEIRTIYYEEYWSLRAPKLHAGVDLVWFNFAVNAGPGEANKLLMRSIGGDDGETVNRMCNGGESFYRGLAQFPRYGRGWTARTERIRAAARKMVAAAPKPQPKDSPVTTPSTTKGHIMVDVTQIETEVNTALDIAEKIIPWISMLVPGAAPVAGFLTQAINAVRSVEKQLGIPTSAALAAAQSHVTPGAPNSPALAG